MGSGARTKEQDFGFRFGAALADAFVERIAFSDDARAFSSDKAKSVQLITESMERMCSGLAQIDPGTMTYALSRVVARMGSIARLGTDEPVPPPA